MSQFVTTKFGRFRAVRDGDKKSWLWEWPNCQTWGNLSLEQWEGRVSVHCTAPKQYHYPSSIHECGYHVTHEFGRELVAVMQARLLFGESQFDPETADA
jgi:hypothetical protein